MPKLYLNKNSQLLHGFPYLFLSCLMICFTQNSCNFSGTERNGDTGIVDVRNKKVPEENLAAHKKYDVEVFRTTFVLGESYLVRYYQNENDTLKSHTAYYHTEEDFDRVAYKWLSDTSVSIRLYNKVSKNEKSFKVFGYGSMSGMSDD